ncbi:MAG TPA: glutaredoxin family protein [Usitatibacter sp.]|nr:glutaredoxin family protein [Usitatibacter sp.]
MVPKLTVLARAYCHLCEEMIAALKHLQGRFSFEIEVIDVDRHPRLEEKWGDKVPVLLDGERELCHYHLDLEAVDARLSRMK